MLGVHSPVGADWQSRSVLQQRLLAAAQPERYASQKPPILRRSEGRSRLDDRISITGSQNSFQNQFLKALVRQRVLKVSNLD